MSNPYLNFREINEQNLAEDLIIEAIDIHSEKFYYIPRKLVSPDEILGEDRLSEFKHAYPIDMYLESVPNLEGQGALIQRFGSMIDYTANLLVSRKKWKELVGNFGQTLIPDRPCEGDLIFYPLGKGLFEIKYVDDKNPYAQLGQYYTFRLTIESFQFNSETFDTGNSEIDFFESLKTFNEESEKSVNKGITSIEILDGGRGYKRPRIDVISEFGRGARFSVKTDENGSITKIIVKNEGKGYSENDQLVIRGQSTKEALLKPIFGINLNEAGEGRGTNKEMQNFAEEKVVNFDPENPFGDL